MTPQHRTKWQRKGFFHTTSHCAKFCKRRTAKSERKEGKKFLDEAPKKRRYKGSYP